MDKRLRRIYRKLRYENVPLREIVAMFRDLGLNATAITEQVTGDIPLVDLGTKSRVEYHIQIGHGEGRLQTWHTEKKIFRIIAMGWEGVLRTVSEIFSDEIIEETQSEIEFIQPF
ncbi:MAG: hypothetical protein Q6361_01495 [Candidatus Hermodarchaeota archaeon]|nr:hypothetical protein [Candidatus Hermodarchaeota archaeon]